MRNQKLPPNDPKNVTDDSEMNTKLEETAGEEISDEEFEAASANKLKILNKTLTTENKKKDKEESDVITESDETDIIKHSEKARITINDL